MPYVIQPLRTIRLFFIEVMGRDSGFIALRAAIAAGVEAVLIPEHLMTIEELINKLETGAKNKKSSSLVVVAEGGKSGNAMEIAAQVEQQFSHYDTKVTVLGHVQRGGTPSCADREIAGKLGVAAVETILMGKTGVMVGIINNGLAITPFAEVIEPKKPSIWRHSGSMRYWQFNPEAGPSAGGPVPSTGSLHRSQH